MTCLRFTIIHRLTLHRGALLAPYPASIQRGGASVASRTLPAARESRDPVEQLSRRPRNESLLKAGGLGWLLYNSDFIFGNPC